MLTSTELTKYIFRYKTINVDFFFSQINFAKQLILLHKLS